jgi:hypothetical protein
MSDEQLIKLIESKIKEIILTTVSLYLVFGDQYWVVVGKRKLLL